MDAKKVIDDAVDARDFDGAIDQLELIAGGRALTTHETVRKGRWILLSNGRPGRQPPDAKALFEAALRSEPDFMPALIEMGWYCYTIDDDAAAARPYFERALPILKRQAQEVAEGWANCVAEMQGRADAYRALDDLAGSLIDQEAIRRELLPVLSDE